MWCSTPFEMTRSNVPGLNAGLNRFICRNGRARRLFCCLKAVAIFSELRHRSVPITVRLEIDEKVRELSCAAAALDHARAVRNLIVKELGKQRLPRLVDEAADAVEVVVIGKWVRPVERFDLLGDVLLRVAPLIRHEK